MNKNKIDKRMRSQRLHISAIDSLRAIAAMIVVAEHSSTLLTLRDWKEHSIFRFINLGFGVDLFFVISGFVVTLSLIPFLSEIRGDFANFWKSFLIRRFFRLAPVCFFWLAFILIFSRLVPPQYAWNFPLVLREAIGIATYLYNFMWAFNFFIVNPGSALGYHFSLNIEEQFYFILPVVLLFVRIRNLAIISVLIIAFTFAFSRPVSWYYFRYDGFLYGIVLAIIFERFKNLQNISTRLKFWQKAVGTIAIWGLLIAMVRGQYLSGNSHTFETVELIAAGIVALAACGFLPLLSENLDGMSSYIGKRSYTLYLSHMPVFTVINSIVLALGWSDSNAANITLNRTAILGLNIFSIAICWAIVEFVYRFIELPLRSYGRRVADTRHSNLNILVAESAP